MRLRLTSLLLATALAAPPVALSSGCKNKTMIPGTEIPDTPSHRAIIDVLERYRKGFVKKDAAAVLSTAHKVYFDRAGTDDPSDDVGYEQLGVLLRARMSQIDSLRFTMDYVEVHVNGDRAVARVWIDAAFRMKPLLDGGGVPRENPRYSRMQDYNEFELLREGDTWLITRGL